MVTRYTVVQDGQVYEPGNDVPDMGSITALESKGKYTHYSTRKLKRVVLPMIR